MHSDDDGISVAVIDPRTMRVVVDAVANDAQLRCLLTALQPSRVVTNARGGVATALDVPCTVVADWTLGCDDNIHYSRRSVRLAHSYAARFGTSCADAMRAALRGATSLPHDLLQAADAPVERAWRQFFAD